MNTFVERFFSNDVRKLTSELGAIEEAVEPAEMPEDPSIIEKLEHALSAGLTACRQLENEIAGDDELLKICQERFRRETSPWCNQSWIIHRARTKPRGFPGDYQMLSVIYDGVPISRGFGGYLDRICLKMTLGRAVASRLGDARNFLEEELSNRDAETSILNVASGPGREYRSPFHLPGNQAVHIKCVDSDNAALHYFQRQVDRLDYPNMNFEFVRHNALRMRSAPAVIKKFGANDVIYSVGLADYIPDKLLIPMLRCWRESLRPDGVVYVAFKDSLRYNPVEYQWLMDWHFLQRDEDDCLRLLESAGYRMDQLETTRDKTGVILEFAYRPLSYSYLRLDQAESVPTSIAGSPIPVVE